MNKSKNNKPTHKKATHWVAFTLAIIFFNAFHFIT